MVVINEIDCESNVFCGGGLSIISFNYAGNCNDFGYHKKDNNHVIKCVNEEGDNEKRPIVDLLEWLKINGFSQKSVNNEHVFVNVNESKSENKDSQFMVMDTINDPIINENTLIESVNGHVDEQTQIEVKDYPTVIFPNAFVAPEIDIEFGSLGPFNKIHNGDMKIEPNCGSYNNNFDVPVNDIKSVSSLETESEAETQKSVLSIEEKHSDDQTEKEVVENNQIMETEEPYEITENKEIEITDEKTTEVMENKQSGKTDEITKEEIEAKLEENMIAKKAMRKKRKAEEARMRAEKRAQKEAEERAQKELKEAEEKEKPRLKRLKKKGKKRTTSSSNIKGGDVAGSNESKETEYTNEKEHQCSPPRAPAAAMPIRSKGHWRPMVLAATLIPVMFALNTTNFF